MRKQSKGCKRQCVERTLVAKRNCKEQRKVGLKVKFETRHQQLGSSAGEEGGKSASGVQLLCGG